MKLWRRAAFVFVVFCFSTILILPASAQSETCSAIVEQALAEVDQDCAATGRNQACYGYVSLEATPREGAVNFLFDKQGDLANVADLDTLSLSALDAANDQWGIALLKLQANLPDTLPGQNVTFLLFGDVQLENAVDPVDPNAPEAVTISVTANGGANVRSAPSREAEAAGSLAAGDTTSANGRSSDGTWVRIQIPNSSDFGWVSANLLIPEGDLSSLSVIDATGETQAFTPMQAFYFRTGIGATTCADAPADGILIQTPKGAGEITLRANDVDIQLGSTAYLQSIPGAEMTVSVVEGEGHVTSNGVTVDVPAGTQVTIPVDENMRASGEPSAAQPYAAALVEALPISLLPEQIEIAPPATVEAQPTQTAGDVPGADPFGGMNPQMFCMMMGPALAQQGISREETIAMLQSMSAQLAAAGISLPADSQAGMDQMLAMLEQC
ncbi:MAG: SH3 domain-containing protein, partial [Chloroflexota bacterium]